MDDDNIKELENINVAKPVDKEVIEKIKDANHHNSDLRIYEEKCGYLLREVLYLLSKLPVLPVCTFSGCVDDYRTETIWFGEVAKYISVPLVSLLE